MMKPRVFISYVREDASVALAIAKGLEGLDLEVWIDQWRLLPGMRWKEEIRAAIKGGSYFVACFSDSYLQRDRTYMNEELTLAIEELRLRPHGRTWFIPVVIGECTLPPLRISSSEQLSDFQAILVGADTSETVAAIHKVIDPQKHAIQALARRLRHSSARVRVSAADQLAILGRSAVDSVELLVALLDDENETVNVAAAHAIASVSPPTAAVMEALLSRASEKRAWDWKFYATHAARAALESLCRSDPEPTTAFLVGCLRERRHESTVLVVLESLGEVPDHVGAALAGLLIERAGENIFGTLARVIGSLAKSCPGALPVLAQVAFDRGISRKRRIASIRAIGRYRSDARPYAKDLRGLIKRAKGELFGASVEALVSASGAECLPFLESLLASVHDEDKDFLLKVLTKLGSKAATPHLLARLEALRNPEISPADYQTAREIVACLTRLRDPRSAPALGGLLRDREFIQANAGFSGSQVSESLRLIRSDSSVGALAELLDSGWAPFSERYTAIAALGEIRSPTAIPTLEKYLSDENADLRCRALQSLALIGGAQSLAAVAKILSEKGASYFGDGPTVKDSIQRLEESARPTGLPNG